jgi:hypothetical protein
MALLLAATPFEDEWAACQNLPVLVTTTVYDSLHPPSGSGINGELRR